jgi:[ribosomal protein S18]-alanine N-acetyltransferase
VALLAVRVERLSADLVSRAQLMAIDATAFPAPSLRLGTSSAESAHTWVARAPDTGEVVGFAATARQPPGLYVFGLAVSESYRGRGVGRALVRAVLSGAREVAARRVGLHVAVGNEPAVRLYTGEGFDVLRRVADYYRFGATRAERDAYEMACVV